MALDFDKYNQEIKQWTKEAISDIKNTAAGMDVQHRQGSPSKSASLKKLRDRYRQQDGNINRISINFPRVLIYPTKGAGKGRGGTKGSKWTDKYGNTKSTNPKSFGKMGTAGRKEKPFFNEVIDGANGVEKLADIVVINTGDIIINNMSIK
jgi:hypothetical protein